jgi:hypothetical protein
MAETKQKDNSIDELREAARAKRRHSRIRAFSLGAAALVVLSTTLILLINVLTEKQVPTRYAFLGEGVVEESVDVTATVFYDAIVISAPASGIFVPYLPDGSRVAAGERVGLIVPDHYAADVERIVALKQAIVSRQLSVVPEGSNRALDAVRDKMKSELQNIMSDVRLFASRDDYSSLPEYASALERLVTVSDLSLVGDTFGDSELEEKLASWHQLLSDLEYVSTTLYSEFAGSVFYGQSPNQATLAKAEQLMGPRLQDLADGLARPQKLPFSVEYGGQVASLVHTSKAYLAFYLPNRRANEFDPDSRYAIRLRDGGDWQYVSPTAARGEEGGTVFTCLLPGSLSEGRRLGFVEISFRTSSTRGMRVPQKSLIEYDERDGIAILLKVDSGRITRVPVFVVAKDKSHAIVQGRDGDPLAPRAYDLYVLNPETAQAGAYID